MVRYSVLIKPSAAKELEDIPSNERRRIVSRIQRLSNTPRPRSCEKLQVQDKYRLRQGRYRVLYAVDDADKIVRRTPAGRVSAALTSAASWCVIPAPAAQYQLRSHRGAVAHRGPMQ